LAHKNKTANIPFAYVREVNMTSLAAPEAGRFFSGETGSMSDERMMPAAAVIVAAGAGAVRLPWLLKQDRPAHPVHRRRLCSPNISAR
jgi:hypothetical protein